MDDFPSIIKAIERQTTVLGLAAERQASALERIADALAALAQAQYVETDDQPADPMRTMDSEPRTIEPPRTL